MKAELRKRTTDAELKKYDSREEVLVARGINEVVEWLDPFLYIDDYGDYTLTMNFFKEWDAQRKVWGVE